LNTILLSFALCFGIGALCLNNPLSLDIILGLTLQVESLLFRGFLFRLAAQKSRLNAQALQPQTPPPMQMPQGEY